MVRASTIAAVNASNNHNGIRTPSGFPHGARKPTPLHILEDDPVFRDMPRPRRESIDSVSSDDEPLSPGASALDSSAALILVHEEESGDIFNEEFDFTDDEAEEDDDIVSPVFEIRRTSIPPLPPLSIFLYLLSPYLKLGALKVLTSAESVELKYSIPALFAFAAVSAFSRQLWYMLARYVRKADVMEVVCETFAKSRGKERLRSTIRTVVKLSTAFLHALVAIVYVHESAQYLLPLLPDTTLSRTGFAVIFGSILAYLSTAPSLASPRVRFAAWLSIGTYIIWFGCVIYARAKNILLPTGSWFSHPPSFWQGIFTIAFAFTTSSTLPLYASLKSGVRPTSTGKTPRSRSFRLLSLLSTGCAIALILPLVVFASLPNVARLQLKPKPRPTPEGVQVALSILAATTLILGAPQAILSIPIIPLSPSVWRTGRILKPFTTTTIIVVSLLLSFIRSPSLSALFTPLNATLVVITLASTFFLPALLHISVHFFKRPLAIVIPRTPQQPTAGTTRDLVDYSNNVNGGLSSEADELLQRKERALQKKQWQKRIGWDIGAWVLALVSIAGAVVGVSLVRG